MDDKTIKLHTIATFQGKEYELENLLNGLLNKLEEKDKEIKRLNNIIDELEKDIDLELYKTRANDEYNKGLFNAFRYIKDKLKELKEGK